MKDCIDGLSLYKRFFRFVPLIVRHKVFVIGREKKTWCTFEIQIETTRIQNQIFHIYVQCKYGISSIQNNFQEWKSIRYYYLICRYFFSRWRCISLYNEYLHFRGPTFSDVISKYSDTISHRYQLASNWKI